jgi:ATP-binding cassette subfamily B protein
MVAYRRVIAPLATATERQSDRGTLRPFPVTGVVRVREVSFAYGDRQVLSGLSVEMVPGTTTALVGATGSGKSTLLKLIMRLYDFEGGSIELDGHDVRTIERAYLRAQIGVVTQDTFLFDGSVKDNLLLAAPGATDAELFAALRAAGAEEFIAQLPGGVDAQLGEQGARLSGGQRQRLSIARALLKNARVVIFDEATSHVDNKTEAVIYEGVREQLRDRTVIVVAHRLSTVQHADQICVLKEGVIVERGAHAELLDKNGEYALLWRLQLGLS